MPAAAPAVWEWPVPQLLQLSSNVSVSVSPALSRPTPALSQDQLSDEASCTMTKHQDGTSLCILRNENDDGKDVQYGAVLLAQEQAGGGQGAGREGAHDKEHSLCPLCAQGEATI